MKKSLLILFLFGLMSSLSAQITEPEELKEVELVAVNYKYLDATTSDQVAVPVKMLQEKVAKFDITREDFYQDEYGVYEVSFFIPVGTILAAYDRDGKLIRTIEKFKNISVPAAVREAVMEQYPKWEIIKDVYLVNYHDKKGAEKTYKLKLQNGNEVIRVKTDEKGNIL